MPFDDETPPSHAFVPPPEELNRLAHDVIGAAIEVHRELGPGLPEEAYERGICLELAIRAIPFERQKIIDVVYKGTRVARTRIDLLVDGMLVVEIKSVDAIIPLHRLQTRTYMRIIGQPLGLLINFNVPVLKDGVRRIIDTDPT